MWWWNAAKLSQLYRRDPYYHLLTSNDPPNEDETMQIQKAIQEAEEYLSSHSKPDHENTPLDMRIITSKNRIAALQSTLSISRRVPSEILREIFLCMIIWRTEPMVYYGKQKEIAAWPFTLSHVSRRWRQVALSTPQLWTFLPPLELMPRPSWVKEREVARYRFMVEHSMGLPLQISISLVPGLHAWRTDDIADSQDDTLALLRSYERAGRVDFWSRDHLAVRRSYFRTESRTKELGLVLRVFATFVAFVAFMVFAILPAYSFHSPLARSVLKRILG